MTDILERAARAMTGITPGEWRSVTALGASETGRYLHPESPWRVIEGPPQAIQPETLGKRFFTHAPDADFIAAAPGLVRDLIAEVERLRRPVRYMRYQGAIDQAERSRAVTTPLHRIGDMIVVWANEGDLYYSAAEAVEP